MALFQTIHQLQIELRTSLQTHDDTLSRQILDSLELALNEEYMIDESIYTTSMIIYLLQNDYYGAKYLWKRAPIPIKIDTSEFTKVWNINQSLLQNSLPSAYEVIKSTEWSPEITILIQRLYSHLQQFALNLIQTTYTTIKFTEMMSLLDKSDAQCQEVCQVKNWSVRVEENETFVSIPQQISQHKESRQVSQRELLQTFTQYHALNEMASAPLKFDLKFAITSATRKGERENF